MFGRLEQLYIALPRYVQFSHFSTSFSGLGVITCQQFVKRVAGKLKYLSRIGVQTFSLYDKEHAFTAVDLQWEAYEIKSRIGGIVTLKEHRGPSWGRPSCEWVNAEWDG